MKILLLGKNGQLGWELQRTLAPLGEVTALDYPEIDFSLPKTILAGIRQAVPACSMEFQAIVNAAAYTAVDRAESEPGIAHAINAEAPGLLAEEARRTGAAFIHFSTDYVFDGRKGEPYCEADLPNPLNEYGKSKLAGEQAVRAAGGLSLIFRTSWVYSLRRDSFVTKALQWSRQQKQLRLVSDQVSGPTWARMLAEVTAQLLAKASPAAGWLGERRQSAGTDGLFHLAGSGWASRLEWGQAILEFDPQKAEQVTEEIVPAKTSEFPSPAERPLFSALNCELFTETFGLRLPDWKPTLCMAMETQR
jgi:dTDP-4-dehydrorhamnose reductase